MALDQDAFSAVFRKSPMKRAKLSGLQRDAAMVLANDEACDDAPGREVSLQRDTLRLHK